MVVCIDGFPVHSFVDLCNVRYYVYEQIFREALLHIRV